MRCSPPPPAPHRPRRPAFARGALTYTPLHLPRRRGPAGRALAGAAKALLTCRGALSPLHRAGAPRHGPPTRRARGAGAGQHTTWAQAPGLAGARPGGDASGVQRIQPFRPLTQSPAVSPRRPAQRAPCPLCRPEGTTRACWTPGCPRRRLTAASPYPSLAERAAIVVCRRGGRP